MIPPLTMSILESRAIDPFPLMPTRCPTLAETESFLSFFLFKKNSFSLAFPPRLFHLSAGIKPALTACMVRAKLKTSARLISDHKLVS